MIKPPDNQAFPKSLPEIPASLRVTWNGRSLVVHQARVSAFPFNRVWAGFQRPQSQTKPAAFVSFDMDGPGELAIGGMAEAARSDTPPVILPLAAAPACRRGDDGSWHIALDRPRPLVVVFGDGAFELHIFANPPFIEAQSGGASGLRSRIRRFGPGEHDVGVVVAQSGETIVIEEGAVVYGAILVANAHDVRIVGRGIIDGSRLKRADHGSAAWQAAVDAGLPPGFYGAEMAVNGITVFASARVAIEGVILRDPPRWTIIVRGGSRDVTIDNVKIVGCWRYNADGINVCASENVAIRDCFIRSFDDCLIARGDYLECDGPVTRGIVAERCTLWCDWGKCMEVWAGYRPCLIENVRFRDIAVIHPSGVICDVTTWFASSDTHIRDIAFEDIEVDFALPLWCERIQEGDETFPAELRAAQPLLHVDCSRYGRYLGNQHWEPATDLSSFRVRYEDIAFRHLRRLGASPRLTALIDASTSPHTIERVTLEDLPPAVELTCKGLAEEIHMARPLAKEAAKVLRLLARQFLSTLPDDFRPNGYDGEMEYGSGCEINYAVASLWFNLLACSRLIGDDALESTLIAAFAPYRGPKRDLFAPVGHVDFSLIGAVPLEIARLQHDPEALDIGLSLADAQWAEPQQAPAVPLRSPLPFETRLDWWSQGYSPETRLWIDDAYMVAALQTQAFRTTGDARYLDRAARELLLYVERLRRPDGLYRHQAEQGPLAWCRGNGWMAAALAIVLGCDTNHPGLLSAFRDFAAVLLRHQHPDGLWGQIVDEPSFWSESSGSAMFAFALSEGVRLGLLEASMALPAVEHAWRGLLARLDERGNLAGTCQGTGPSADHGYYLSRPRPNGDPHGQAGLCWLCRSFLEG